MLTYDRTVKPFSLKVVIISFFKLLLILLESVQANFHSEGFYFILENETLLIDISLWLHVFFRAQRLNNGAMLSN